MTETWEDLVIPVRRVENAMANYGQGYVSPALDSGDGEIYDTSNVLARMPQDTAVTRGMRGAANFVRSESQPDNIISAGLDSAANWMDWSPQVGPDTLAPLGGAAIGTLVSPRNAVGIFGGRLAQTADQAALRRAEEMAATGADRRAIWDETGWYKGADDQWRFEINDRPADLSPEMRASFDRRQGLASHPLGDNSAGGGITHRDLYAAYPDATNLDFEARRMSGPWSGTYAEPQPMAPRGRVSVIAPNASDARSVALHELQHDVQMREGFARGADSRDMESGAIYRSTSGEVEARNVQARADMTPQQRRATPPWETQDTPDAQHILSPREGRTAAVEQSVDPGAVTPERAIALLGSIGARVTQVKNVRGTTYIKFEDPTQPHLPFQAQPTIRIPADHHAGRPPRPGEAGVLFDTASQPGRGPVNPLTATDEAGRPYADFNVLESTLRRRFGQQPEPNAPRPQGPDNSPDQPRLLSGGAPVAANGWAAAVNDERSWEPDDVLANPSLYPIQPGSGVTSERVPLSANERRAMDAEEGEMRSIEENGGHVGFYTRQKFDALWARKEDLVNRPGEWTDAQRQEYESTVREIDDILDREQRQYKGARTDGRMHLSAPPSAASAVPIWNSVPEMAVRESEDQGNAGRFAAPLVSPDAQLAADTRSMSDRVSVATRNVESDFDWSDLVVPVTPHAMAGIRRAHNAMAAN